MEKKRYSKAEENGMKVKVLKKSGNELKIEIEGSSHGLCNLLQKRLLEDKKVDFAGYDLPHPLASSPIIYVRMKGDGKPEDALIKAVEKVREANDAFSKELERALKA
jgi:DNA-directed RNA polymerase subunit L